MDPHRRAGDTCADPDAVRCLGDRAENAPDERALTLLVEPRVEVIGDERVLEAALLGEPRVLDELARSAFLRRERVAHGDGHMPWSGSSGPPGPRSSGRCRRRTAC